MIPLDTRDMQSIRENNVFDKNIFYVKMNYGKTA